MEEIIAINGTPEDEERRAVMDESLRRIENGLPLEARREFGPLEKACLRMSFVACDLLDYPAVTGDPDGDRAAGDMICEICQRKYFDHPHDWRVIGYGNVPFLNVLCDGSRVKL